MSLHNAFGDGESQANAGSALLTLALPEPVEHMANVLIGNAWPAIRYGYEGMRSLLAALDNDASAGWREFQGVTENIV